MTSSRRTRTTPDGWAQHRFSDVIDFQEGPGILAKDFRGEGVPLIRLAGLEHGASVLDGCNCLDPEMVDARWSHFRLREGDILLSTSASLGRTAVVSGEAAGAVAYTGIIRMRPKDNLVLAPFIRYLLQGREFQIQAEAMGAGSVIRHFGPFHLRQMAISLPPLEAQRAIVSILSAFDDLLDNSTRRIQILEEVTKRLYKEWFIDLRFPGHERARESSSELGLIPSGWSVQRLGDVCSSIADGDWIETKDQGGSDYRLLQVSNVGVGYFVETDNYRYVTTETFKRLRCQEVISGDILISRMPKPTGRAWLVTPQPWRMITAVDVAIAKVEPKSANPYFALALLNSPEHLARVEKRTTGTTRPRISRSSLMSIPTLIPPLSLQDRFGKLAEQTYRLVDVLRKRNAKLRRTRDLLLPKLLSGELDVSKLDIPTEAIA